MAMSISTGRVDQQEVQNMPKDISPKERQLWAHVAAHTAEVMGNLAKGFEERQFDDDLAKLEKLVDDIKILQDQADQQQNTTKDGKTEIKHDATETTKVNDS
jgi:hypothetical protein